MNAYTSLKLMKKYSDCPKCGNGLVGNGEGKMIIDDDTFFRSCKCGWKVEIKEGQE